MEVGRGEGGVRMVKSRKTAMSEPGPDSGRTLAYQLLRCGRGRVLWPWESQ